MGKLSLPKIELKPNTPLKITATEDSDVV